MKKIISIVLSVALLLGIIPISVTAKGKKSDDFIITNPYENVDWDEWKSYKTQLHCHTSASDGFLRIKDAIQLYYDLDYDVVAITDHGTNNLGWNNVPQTIPLLREARKERTGGAKTPIIPLEQVEYEAFLNGTAKTSDGTVRTNNAGMVDVQLGNELNMATPFADCHLTNYWSYYGQGLAGVYGDYETPAGETAKDGGISMIAHPGEYVYTNTNTTSRYHVGQPVKDYYANKFARIFLDNAVGGKYSGSCVGMGINSSEDEHTRCDRILYDQILQKTIPNGVVPWGFTFSDSHNISSMNNAYTMTLTPDWTNLNNDERNVQLRKCMENGEFFSVSHYSNGFELDGEREFTGIDLDTSWPAEQLLKMNDTPMVTEMTVDEETDTITVKTKNADRIVWVSNGQVIKRECDDSGVFTINLHEDGLKNDVKLFLRFYITGPQGICYSQPLTIHETDENGNMIEFTPVVVPKTHDISTFLRKFVTVIDKLFFKYNPVIWAFKYFALGYDPIERLASGFVK